MAKDPYRYFRIEARELLDGLKQGVLDLEKGHTSKELVARLLRLAHTLKGAARVVRLPKMSEQAHALEDMLEPHRDGASVPADTVSSLLGVLDAAGEAFEEIAPPAEETRTQAAAPVPVVETVRVELDEMDRLLQGLAEATSMLNAVRRDPAVQGRQSLSGAIEQIGAELDQVRESAHRLRLAPVSTVFATLQRAVRDTAQALDKVVDFRTSGGDTRLDAHVLTPLQDALLHVVRNAVAHGVETPSQRRAAGKAPAGVVEVRVERRTGKVVFLCRDDGRGIDLDGLRRAAADRGVLAGATTADELVTLMLGGGLSTSTSVSQISGRGIGLDVVREVTTRLKGHVRVRTSPGEGTTFEIVVPVALNAVTALVVRDEEVFGAIPLESIRETTRVKETEIAHAAGAQSIIHRGQLIPFAPLAPLMRGSSARRSAHVWSAVVVEAGSSLAAIGVDQLVRTGEVVVRTLPPHAEADPIVAGASLDQEGNAALVLDPEGLVAAARAALTVVPPRTRRLPILVIDDSLTTRMLEQSILESAGYEVELATSAEEGLEKAGRNRYGVFIVDVEMPGMDGFEFVSRTRADAALREVPAILVTSRMAQEDRDRGREVGAHAYIVKGEFDQVLLLDTIRELQG